jgi:carboxypeptidase family protein
MPARTSVLIVAVLLTLGGCSGGRKHPATAPVSGTVTYQGKPVEGATVSFSLVGGGGVSTAITDATGKYVLRTFGEADGAVPGDYKVTITKIKAEDRNPGKTPEQISEEYAAILARGEQIPEPVITYLVPEKYSTAKTTPEQRTVKAGEPNVIDFQLAD